MISVVHDVDGVRSWWHLGLKVDDDAEVDQKDHIDIIIMNFEKVKVAVNMTSKYINPLKRIKEFAHDQRKVKLPTSFTVLKLWKPKVEKMHIVVPNVRNHLVELQI